MGVFMKFIDRYNDLLEELRDTIVMTQRRRGLTQQHIADQTGVNRWTIGTFMKGHDLSAKALRAIMAWADKG